MRKKSVLMVPIIFVFAAFAVNGAEIPSVQKAPAMPDNVKVIVEKSCFGCHNTDSKNDKAKEDLDFKKFDTLTKQQMIHALKEIGETLEENEMPPAKFLEKNPDKKLTDAEKKILLDWANSEAKSLMK